MHTVHTATLTYNYWDAVARRTISAGTVVWYVEGPKQRERVPFTCERLAWNTAARLDGRRLPYDALPSLETVYA